MPTETKGSNVELLQKEIQNLKAQVQFADHKLSSLHNFELREKSVIY